MQPDLHGRIIDLDSHLMVLPDDLVWILGAEIGRPMKEYLEGPGRDTFFGSLLPDDLETSRRAAATDVWNVKGFGAHGAQLAGDRIDALDQMGIHQQLVIEMGMLWALHTDDEEAFAAVRRYNDHVLDWSAPHRDRLHPACLLNTHRVGVALDEAARLAERGATFVELGCAEPWAGESPASPTWEPLWRMLSDAGITAMFHAGSHGGGGPGLHTYFVSPRWARGTTGLFYPPTSASPPEECFGPFHRATVHMGPETVLTALVLGGVFDRHPGLRFAVVEMGASWVAPWAERLDACADAFASQLAGHLDRRPSETIRASLRVTPYVFEPVGTWIERTGLHEVYVFSTDYPHPEGGRDPIDRFYADVAPLGPAIVEDFFVGNASAVLAPR